MSAIFSDPPFRRGTTLLGGEVIETDANGPIAGREIVGSVKAFQDVVPTGRGDRNSNRLVYCVAARYKGSTVSDASTVAGEAYLFDTGKPLTEFTNKASSSNATAGLAWGVLDEYLTGELRTNDIVWLVVEGPTQIKRTAVAISAGVAVQLSATAGSIAVLSTGIAIGQQIVGAATSASAGLTRVNLTGAPAL
jgi:hypothetical protein